MNKKIACFALAMVFALGTVGTAVAAKKLKCTVDSVEGDKVTMTCSKADKLKAGDKVKVSPPKKANIEGC